MNQRGLIGCHPSLLETLNRDLIVVRDSDLRARAKARMPLKTAPLLLPRSATPLFWLFLTPSIRQPSGWPAAFQRPLPTSSRAPVIRRERIHQLLGSGQFRFGHPRVLPLHPIVPLTTNYFLADDFADFLLVIGICD